MPKSQTFRMLLVGAVFIFGALTVIRFFGGDGALGASADEDLAPPDVIHVARDKATIVRPDDDWMDQGDPGNEVQPIPATSPFLNDDVDDASYLSPPEPFQDDHATPIHRR